MYRVSDQLLHVLWRHHASWNGSHPASHLARDGKLQTYSQPAELEGKDVADGMPRNVQEGAVAG